MPSTVSLPVYTLNLHQGYRCRHSGVCCTAGWDIPIDAPRLARVTKGLATGTIVLPWHQASADGLFLRGEALPDDAAAIVGRAPSGGCVFFDRLADRHCAIHRGLGHASLPAACRHFPRNVLIDGEGVSVAFSHVCPTAAELLFRDDITDLAVVTDPAILADADDIQGFDARDTIPPFVKPGVVFDLESRRVWESFLLRACSRHDETPEQVIQRLAAGADRLRPWTPARGEMAACASEVLAAELVADVPHVRADPEGVARLYAHVMRTVPGALGGVEPPDGRGAQTLWLTWPAAWRTVNRYLGARAFAAWSAYRGSGVRTQVAVLAAALAVLDIEVLRRTTRDGRVPDLALLREALGAADLITVHQSDDAALAAALGAVESQPFEVFIAGLGLTA